MLWFEFICGILSIMLSGLSYGLYTKSNKTTMDKYCYGTIFIVAFIVGLALFLDLAGVI